jgi:tetratricopeptide (TPR) repeat protein
MVMITMRPWGPGSGIARALLGAFGLLALVASQPAVAADSVESRLEGLEIDVQRFVDRSEEIDRQVQPGHGFLGEREATRRFEEHLYEFMVGDYDSAAEGFFALVTTAALADAGLHRDAEWYLAESLYKMGNYSTAESRFGVIAQDTGHPFHDDAVRRLLELYATSGQSEKFREAYDREIVRGSVKPSDLITYSVGKSFYTQKDFLKAKSHLLEIQPQSTMYNKAQYLLGTIMVRESDLVGASEYFKAVLDVSVDSTEDRQILDLALLALGRIHYEMGQFREAADYYGRIGGDSEYLDDKLYEIIWCFIKQQAWEDSLRGVEIFLLAFPEHEYTAQLKLLEGHLHVKKEQYDSALTSYETVIADYTPIRDRFSTLASGGEATGQYFQRLSAMQVEGGTAEDPDLPPYAVAMMTSDPDLSKALTVFREIDHQSSEISESEKIAEELTVALADAKSMAGFDRIRNDVALMRQLGLQHRLDLLRVEEEWLWNELPGRDRGELSGIRERRQQLLEQITATGSKPPYEDLGVLSAIDEVRGGYERMLTRVEGGQSIGRRFDEAHERLAVADEKLEASLARVPEIETEEIVRIRDRVAVEKAEVEKQRSDVDTSRGKAEELSAALTASGFGRLEDFFAESVLRADMGIVDVYWSQKLEVAEKKEAMVQQKNELMESLEDRFDLIRQKLPAGAPAAGSTAAKTDEEGK